MEYQEMEKGQTDYIRPCPHCGAQMQRVNRYFAGMDEGYCMHCPRCEATGEAGDTVDLAIEAWNTKEVKRIW